MGYFFNDAELYYQLLLEEGKTERIFNEPSYENNDMAHSFGLAAAYFKSGKKDLAEKQCDNIDENNYQDYNYYIALAHAYGDEAEEVCLWLERSFEAKEKGLVYLGVDPGFKKFINEPRIISILQKMNFPK